MIVSLFIRGPGCVPLLFLAEWGRGMGQWVGPLLSLFSMGPKPQTTVDLSAISRVISLYVGRSCVGDMKGDLASLPAAENILPACWVCLYSKGDERTGTGTTGMYMGIHVRAAVERRRVPRAREWVCHPSCGNIVSVRCIGPSVQLQWAGMVHGNAAGGLGGCPCQWTPRVMCTGIPGPRRWPHWGARLLGQPCRRSLISVHTPPSRTAATRETQGTRAVSLLPCSLSSVSWPRSQSFPA